MKPLFFELGGERKGIFAMSRWKLKCKLWRDRHSRALYKRRNSQRLQKKTVKILYENGGRRVIITVPKVFSFVKNTEGTMQFIEQFKKIVVESEKRTHIHVDSRSVKVVSVDALIYLLASIDNSKEFKQHTYTGSFPKNKTARRTYIESGFIKYVQTYSIKNSQIPQPTRKMRIERGMKNDSTVIKDICDFVRNTLGFESIKSTAGLYTMLIELLSNAVLHAYESESFLKGKWYIYAEQVHDYVRLVFADTGRGIPETVRKTFSEKVASIIKKVLPINNNLKDGLLIESALLGEFRTNTKERHRGNGLDTVRRIVTSGGIRGFEVISGHGRCSINSNIGTGSTKNIKVEGYAHKMYGTLYVFDIYGGTGYGKNKDL